jgi:hypothetical protein
MELQFVVMRRNAQQRDRIRRFGRELGVDIYSGKPVRIARNDPNFRARANGLLPDGWCLSQCCLDGSSAFSPTVRFRSRFSMFRRQTAIDAAGTVALCCHDHHSDCVMGCTFEEPLKRVRSNDKYGQRCARRASRTGTRPGSRGLSREDGRQSLRLCADRRRSSARDSRSSAQPEVRGA